MTNQKTDFSEITFHGVFRKYQNHILDRVDKYGENSKIHIVAAPGSGKTVLGLEIIRRLNEPVLILSPTTIIQNQWFSRFSELFLSSSQNVEEYTSSTLKAPNLITSITYQGLHSAWNKLQDSCEEKGVTVAENFSDFDILEFIKTSGIKTICLDEAHHLRKSWQLALEQFVDAVKDDVTIVSLTATPPYDSAPSEWSRYISLCGEIDDEIPIPALVKDGTLAPHQDFIYFNRPSEEQLSSLEKYKEKAEICLNLILKSDLIENILSSGGILPFSEDRKYWMYMNTGQIRCLLKLAHHKSIEIPKKLRKNFLGKGEEKLSTLEAQDGLQFVLDNEEMFDADVVERLKDIFLYNSLIKGGKLSFTSNEKINREITNSSTKLKSIGEIAAAESDVLGDNLRLVVITDYIRKESINVVGTNMSLSEISVVSVFEALNRGIGKSKKIAAISGSLMILPNDVISKIDSDCYLFSVLPIKNTNYSQIDFDCSNFQKVELITNLFEKGHISAIVGTKALLGEGWNSPSINSLIIASFVGSFVLSNQIRGRAIRISDDKNKVANIWHLVSVLPSEHEDMSEIVSDDLSVMIRRFNTFSAPSMTENTIENGIHRLNVLDDLMRNVPLDIINKRTLKMACDRKQTRDAWVKAMPLDSFYQVSDVTEIPYKKSVPRFSFYSVLTFLKLTALLEVAILLFTNITQLANSTKSFFILSLIAVVAIWMCIRGYLLLLNQLSPKKFITKISCAIINSMAELGEIKSEGIVLMVEKKKENIAVECWISGGTSREHAIFAKTVKEMFSVFSSAKYIICKENRFLFFPVKDYTYSFACPSFFAANKNKVDVFQKHLLREVGQFKIISTNTLKGRDSLLHALRKSFLVKNDNLIRSKHIVKQELSAEHVTTQAGESIIDIIKNVALRFFKLVFRL